MSVAASFVADSNWASAQLDLMIAGEHDVRISQGKEGEGVARMLEALACVHCSRRDEFAGIGKQLVRQLSGFSACVLVLLELDEARVQLVRQLHAAQVVTLVLLVSMKERQQYQEQIRSLPDADLLFVAQPGKAAQVLATLSSPAAALITPMNSPLPTQTVSTSDSRAGAGDG